MAGDLWRGDSQQLCDLGQLGYYSGGGIYATSAMTVSGTIISGHGD